MVTVNQKQTPAAATRHCRLCDADISADAEHWYTRNGATMHRACPEMIRRQKDGRTAESYAQRPAMAMLWRRAQAVLETTDRRAITRLALKALLREHGVDPEQEALENRAQKAKALLAGLSATQRARLLGMLGQGGEKS